MNEPTMKPVTTKANHVKEAAEELKHVKAKLMKIEPELETYKAAHKKLKNKLEMIYNICTL